MKDKVIDLERELKKVTEICQAMLVYSKDKHYQNQQLENQVNVLLLNQQDQEAQLRSSNNREYKELKAEREEYQQAQLAKLEQDLRNYHKKFKDKQIEAMTLTEEKRRLEHEVDILQEQIRDNKMAKQVDISSNKEFKELQDKLRVAQSEMMVLRKTNDDLNEEVI